MIDLIEYVDKFLKDVFEPYEAEVYYIEADKEVMKLPYVVYESQSDAISRVREDFVFTVHIWGHEADYFVRDEASEKIKQYILDGTLKTQCAPMTIAVDYMGRSDIPTEGQQIRVKEVRFKVRYYNI
ncbi:hypothetical protein P4388_34245 [Bacillus thuringiensis]|uniref:head protein n=1 Tax=Bacillus phage phi4B1 TaxID=1643324 RepID=UPI000200F42E|nr:hypothetical protein [Bacillus paranthracis]YP_009206314.1 head protein [Bacillus phage phi4B1]ADY20366.1 hypothetical protein YBT020_05600 [Bacillus thuringiensis serovar finitimus YBT-020]MEB9698168.1 hypothetical protein [Bacillus cereus]MED3289249.1 hypothetical protein [Bacillus thuringiensis]OTX71308.1 hypothetical protein BK722_12910 [Bacillus thuringiensis serovar finitimus]PGZ45694.1 hypothetical protein COE56_25780 [Bacillus anthracis]